VMVELQAMPKVMKKRSIRGPLFSERAVEDRECPSPRMDCSEVGLRPGPAA
jgi:hypothetical protein